MQEVARRKMEKTVPITLAWDESQDIGSDTLNGVSDAGDKVPFVFTSTTDEITLDISRPQLSDADVRKLEEAMASQGDKG